MGTGVEGAGNPNVTADPTDGTHGDGHTLALADPAIITSSASPCDLAPRSTILSALLPPVSMRSCLEDH
jgi:hypothetical protein